MYVYVHLSTHTRTHIFVFLSPYVWKCENSETVLIYLLFYIIFTFSINYIIPTLQWWWGLLAGLKLAKQYPHALICNLRCSPKNVQVLWILPLFWSFAVDFSKERTRFAVYWCSYFKLLLTWDLGIYLKPQGILLVVPSFQRISWYFSRR